MIELLKLAPARLKNGIKKIEWKSPNSLNHSAFMKKKRRSLFKLRVIKTMLSHLESPMLLVKSKQKTA